MKKLIISSILVSTTLLLFGCKQNIDPAKLRQITDDYRSNPERINDFVPQSDGTVIDKRTGLQWMRCSLGQVWTGKICDGKPTQYTWDEAMQQKSDFAKYTDWRLPTIFELETLVYCSSGKDYGREKRLKGCKGEYQFPTIIETAFPNTPGLAMHWSSTTIERANSIGGLNVYFLAGSDYFLHKERKISYVRLVRDRQ